MSHMFAFMSAVVTVQGSVGMFVVYRELLKVVGFIGRCKVLCVVYLYSGCDGYCAFCLTCLLKQFAIFLGEVAIFLLNVMVQFCGVGAALLESP